MSSLLAATKWSEVSPAQYSELLALHTECLARLVRLHLLLGNSGAAQEMAAAATKVAERDHTRSLGAA